MIKTNILDKAAVLSASTILEAKHVSVAESIQLLLGYIAVNEDKDMARASASHIKEVLRLVCEDTEPELAVL